MKTTLIAVLTFLTTLSNAHSILPDSFPSVFAKKGLDKKYELASYIKPSYLQADFNGDKQKDIAVLIIEKKTSKKGVMIIHGQTHEYFILGAGKELGSGSDNFSWLSKWSIYNNKKATETQFDEKTGDILGSKEVTLKSPALNLENPDASAGGLIYWNGKKYVWIHQGE